VFEPRNLKGLLQLFNIDKKREVKQYCRNLVIYSSDLSTMILAAEAGILTPYKYACHFDQHLPEHLHPTEEEFEASGRLRVGPIEGKAKKFFTKAGQAFKERRLFAAHLFYEPSHYCWHLFYFDQRDSTEVKNHWKFGAHIHYLSDMFTSENMSAVWEKVLSGNTTFSNSLHIRYEQSVPQARA